MQDGILLVDKPAGISSFGVVSRVRRILSKERGAKVKVGHAGTLDPFATGLLIILIGKATKQADAFLKLDKSYFAELKLGEVSSTGDPEGDITAVSAEKPSVDAVTYALKKFVGDIYQIPPAFSAIKVNGQRAYKLARQGKEVKIAARKITVYGIDNVQYEYPKLNFDVRVSSGTYIRSLAADIGKEIRCGAYLVTLRRTSIDKFNVNEACEISDQTTAFDLTEKLKPLHP